MTGLQWIASDAWSSHPGLQTPDFMPYMRALGIAFRHGEIPGLKDFLLKTHPDNGPDNSRDNAIVSLLVQFVFKLQFLHSQAISY